MKFLRSFARNAACLIITSFGALAAPKIDSITVEPSPIVVGETFKVRVLASDDVAQGYVMVDFRPSAPTVLRVELVRDLEGWTGTSRVPGDLKIAEGSTVSVKGYVFDATRTRGTAITKVTALNLPPLPLGLSAPVISVSELMTVSSDVTVSGTAPGATIVRISGGASLVDAQVVNQSFSAQITLTPNKVNKLFVVGVDSNGSHSPPSAASVTHDGQAPNLFIDFPAEGSQLTTDKIDVAGRVGDVLSGFLGLDVTVNGMPAEVVVGIGNNGSFEKAGVPLAVGANTITVTAADALGNTTTKTLALSRIAIPSNVPTMKVVSGNSQVGKINQFLSESITVEVLRADKSPFENKLVTFEVIRSNGRLTNDGQGEGSLVLQSRTDAQGKATARWRLGSDAGCGNNRIKVTARDIVGSTFFCASAAPGPSTQINIGTGNNQKAETGAPAPEPLRAWVSDGCNGVAGVPVTFEVATGSGEVNGSNRTTVVTGKTGHAEATYTLGNVSGNQTVTANFPGNTGGPATFTISGLRRDANQATTFSGLVLDNANQPIGGAAASLVFPDGTTHMTNTDEQGQFIFGNLQSAGPAGLFVDGLVAKTLGGNPISQGTFPSLHFDLIVVPQAANGLPMPVLLPMLDPANARTFDGTQDVELTVAGVEGIRMLVKAGSMKRADGTIPSPSNPAIIALNQVHHDKVPMPMPDGAAPPFAWTLQPGGATFDPPIQITYPNMTGLPAGSIAYFLSFNHDTGKFEIVSSGSVTPDGAQIVSDPGAGLAVAGWGCNCPPYSVTEDCEKCSEKCVESGSLSPSGTVGVDKPNAKADETVTFTFNGSVTDSGGGKEEVCEDGSGSSIEVPPGTITYKYRLATPSGAISEGTGKSASIKVKECGNYTCSFSASVDRECAPASLSLGSATSGVSTTGEYSPHSFAGTVAVPPEILGKIERAINKLPNVTVDLDSVEGSATSNARDCCKDGNITADGDRFKEASASITASLKGIKLWGPPTISKMYDWGVLEADIDFQAGVVIDSNFAVGGTIGQRTNECIPESCPYGSFDVGSTVALKATLDVIACAETVVTDKSCIDVEVTPAALSIGFNGNVGYNSKEACNGLTGDVTLGKVVFSATFTVAQKGIKYEYEIFSGFK